MIDRFLPGVVGGVVAGLVIDLVNGFNYYILRVTTLRNLDWAAVIVYGHLARYPVETFLAEIWHLVWTAMLGVIYAYGARLLPTPHRYLRGLSYGLGVWFFIYAGTLLFKVPYVRIVPWRTALSNFTLGIIFGLVLAYVVGRLLERQETGN